MSVLRRLTILAIAIFVLLPALPAAAQTPAASEIPPIDTFAGIEAAVDRTWAGLSVVAATVVWLAAQTLAATRSRELLYDLPDRSSGAMSEGEEASA